MLPNYQILTTPENSSFISRVVNRIWLENELHIHEENELIYFISGKGTAYIGQKEITFEPGDVFLIGRNCIHRFQPNDITTVEAIVVQFSSNCFGNHFLLLPECITIGALLQIAKQGLRFDGKTRTTLQLLIYRQQKALGIDRLILLLQCLQAMCATNEYTTISCQAVYGLHPHNENWIHGLFRFTEEYFQTHITLQRAASAVCMSVPSFCHYFKQYTQKTYNDYLNEVRINYACRQLRETNKTVSEIGYESGYNTIAHFHRQFFKIKNFTPLQYRRAYRLSPFTINLKAI